jgi:hypothetical protein
MKKLLLVLVLVVPILAWSVGKEGWRERARVEYPSGNLTLQARWAADHGLGLRLASATGPVSLVVEFDRKAPRIRVEPEGAVPASVVEAAQFNLAALPDRDVEALEVVVKFRPDLWSIYLGNRLALIMPAPFKVPAIVEQGQGSLPSEGHRDVRFQKTEDFVFHDDFLVPEGQEDGLTAWEMQSGNWSLHSVLEEVDPNILKKAKPDAKGKSRPPRKPVPDRSPNFYSLKGSGTNALLLSGYEFYDTYTLETAMQVGAGEGGVAFYCSETDGFYAFTVKAQEESDTVRLSLWKTSSLTGTDRVELAAATSEILAGEWIMLKVNVFPDRIQCSVDKTLVLDVPAEVPVGGRFGIFANAEGTLLFDDVTVRSNHELVLRSVNDFRRYTLVENGRFLPRTSFLNRSLPQDAAVMAPAASGQPQWLILGSPVHAPHVFGAEFEPASQAGGEVGLIAGYTDDHQSYWRFVCRRTRTNESFRLEAVGTNGAKVVRELTLAPDKAKDALSRPVRLTGDTTFGPELRFYRNGDLVMVHHADTATGGGSGVYVGPDTQVRIVRPEYRFERTDLYTDQFEKNSIFTADPFMRHWSSPEGQWEDVIDNAAWYKGDVLGRVTVHLPLVDQTTVHLGVPEGGTTGVWQVRVDQKNLSLSPGGRNGAGQPVASATTGLITGYVGGESNRVAGYAIHAEGHWIWVTSGGKLLFQHALSEPFKGRRIRIEGFTTAQLASSQVERYNVKDFLFKESLHEWTINGGCWEVINRFRCDPRWSHMNGESSNTLAAIWSKYNFRGDFCVEMYAGTRMGWYERCGDYNLTVLNRDTSPSQGYTVTCSGWDYDLSQLFTKLYRNGTLMTQSDAYCAPRSRSGNKRKERSALINTGRDVHGAWYYIKFRRVGTRLEYYFDNDLVFTCTDTDPLRGGSLGVWTFMNSMMVARVKMAAEAIEPRPLAFTPCALPATASAKPAAPVAASDLPAAAPARVILASGIPLAGMHPSSWEAADPVSRARLTWHAETNARPFFTMTSVLGSGSMLARCDLPPVPMARMSGWSFDVKRTPRSLFNFFYSIGRLNAAGVYEPRQRYFHCISGEDFSENSCRLKGRSEVGVIVSTRPDWYAAGEWVPVKVWLPTEGYEGSGSDTGLLVKVEGFGNLTPGYAVQGLMGNGPREGYAIRDFTVIFSSRPQLTVPKNTPAPSSVTLLAGEGQPRPVGPLSWGAVNGKLANAGGNGLAKVMLDVQWTQSVERLPVMWSALSTGTPLTCAWSQTQPDTVEIRSDPRCLDRDLAYARVTIAGQAVSARLMDAATLAAQVPRTEGRSGGAGMTVPVTVLHGTRTNQFQLAWADARLRLPPVLAKLEGLGALFENFEQREVQALAPDRMRIDRLDPVQGSYLTIFNTMLGQRLAGDLGKPFSLSRYPLLRFRYRGGPMSRVSLSLSDGMTIQLSEDLDNARSVRGAGALLLDNQWHTWSGMISDAMIAQTFQPGLLTATRLRFGSMDKSDQTGRYSELSLDDLTISPAVSRNEQLAFTPSYVDGEGVAQVSMALRSGPEDFDLLSGSQRAALVWRDIPNQHRTVPEIGPLADGPAHLFIKARSARGRESQVTDVPFLLDRVPPVLTGLIEPSVNPLGNGTCLRVKVKADGGAPLDVDTMAVKWNKTVVPLTHTLGSTLGAVSESAGLVLNWPYVFRNQIARTTSNEVFTVTVANLRDGAGNVAPDVEVTRRIDYASDHTPPTLLPAKYPSNVLWTTAWEAPSETRTFFTFAEGATATVVRQAGDAPYLALKAHARTGLMTCTMTQKWTVAAYPYLAFRLRRTVLPTNDTARLDLTLETGSTNRYVLALTKPRKGDNWLNHPYPLVWQSNVWESFTLDVGSLVRKRLPADEFNKIVIKKISLRLSDTTPGSFLHAQGFFVFAPWGGGDRVTLDAYDESGLETVVSEALPRVDGLFVEPEDLSGSDGHGWKALRVRDRAGNLSLPLWVPIYGRKGEPMADPVGVLDGQKN